MNPYLSADLENERQETATEAEAYLRERFMEEYGNDFVDALGWDGADPLINDLADWISTTAYFPPVNYPFLVRKIQQSYQAIIDNAARQYADGKIKQMAE